MLEQSLRDAGVRSLRFEGDVLTFHLPADVDASDLLEKLGTQSRAIGASLEVEQGLAAVTLVGTGVLDATQVASRAARTLTEASIPIQSLQAGSVALTILLPEAAYSNAVQRLHATFVEAKGH